MNEFLQKHNITLVYNHAIYFKDLKETVYGVLAEDTNWMIKNIFNQDASYFKEIEDNLSLLRTFTENKN